MENSSGMGTWTMKIEQLECDESEAAFEAVVKKVTAKKPNKEQSHK